MGEENQRPLVENPLTVFTQNFKESVEMIKKKHNEVAQVVEKLLVKQDEFEKFLIFNSRKYRKFVNKNKFKNKY